MFELDEDVWVISCVDYQEEIFNKFVAAVVKEKRDVRLIINYDEFCFLASKYDDDVFYITTVWNWEWNNEKTIDEMRELLIRVAKQLYAKRIDVVLERFCDRVRKDVVDAVQFKQT
ncbi:MAG: hypothetical protein IJM54_09850 [Thermoguttaceae bacterium]|nr:hypothetical protein [Thermoguttaceae bacterium]MBR5759580.1 hypothetical protein [Thermoguttaceae bacterium]